MVQQRPSGLPSGAFPSGGAVRRIRPRRLRRLGGFAARATGKVTAVTASTMTVVGVDSKRPRSPTPCPSTPAPCTPPSGVGHPHRWPSESASSRSARQIRPEPSPPPALPSAQHRLLAARSASAAGDPAEHRAARVGEQVTGHRGSRRRILIGWRCRGCRRGRWWWRRHGNDELLRTVLSAG